MKQKITFLALALLISFGLSAQETLITAWTFDGLAETPNTPLAITSNSDIGELPGSGTIYADGTNGSDAFETASITSFTGYTNNDPRTPAVSGRSLGFITMAANGKSLVLKFSTIGYANIIMTFAVRGTATGYNNHAWEYSTDGTNFTSFEVENTAHNAGGSTPAIRTLDFSSITALNDQPNVYIRLTISGATNDSGTNRFDNIQIGGTQSGPDIYAPRLMGCDVPNATSVKLTFNEALDQTIAETATNYTIDGYSVTAASLTDTRFVTLTVNPALTEGDDYTMTIRNMQDLAENVMADSTFTFTYGVSSEYHKATIADLKAAAPAFNDGPNTGTTIYKFSGEAIITYMMSNRNQKYMQDATGGIMIDDPAGILASGFETGDKVTGIYGTLTNYYGLIEFVPTETGTTVGWNEEVDPELVTLADFDSLHTNPMQSTLVMVDHVTFATTGTFATNTYYALAQNGQTYPDIIYTNNWSADYIGQEIPTYSVALKGIATYTRGQNRLIILDKNSIVSVNSYNASAIRLAPNPAMDYVNIETGEAMQMELFSITGQLVYAENLNAGRNIIPLSDLTAGIYIVKLTAKASGETRSEKLIVR